MKLTGRQVWWNNQWHSKSNVPINQWHYSRQVYEVMRCMNGHALFLTDHLHRLQHTLAQSHLPQPYDLQHLKGVVYELIERNQAPEANIHLRFYFHENGQLAQSLATFVVGQYPDESQYRQGVPVGIITGQRQNPQLKVWQGELRERADKEIRQQQVFEVLLATPTGWVPEGSRSNVFFMNAQRLVTAPLSMVLPGITRRYVLDAARQLPISVQEQAVHKDDWQQFQAAFLSGTSALILPISRIGTHPFDARFPLLRNLMDVFHQRIQHETSSPQ